MSLRLLLDAFPGSKVIMDMKPIPKKTTVIRVVERLDTADNIRDCNACALRSIMDHHGFKPVPCSAPSVTNKSPATFMAIGEAPGGDEARRGQPFIGSSGRLLRSMLDSVGLDSNNVLYANTVSCWPTNGQLGKGIKTRTPGEGEMRACREHLLAQVGLSQSTFILLVGGTALKSVRPDLKVSTIHGRLLAWHLNNASYWVMPVYHPAAILRQGALRGVTLSDLETWAKLIHGTVHPSSVLSGQMCVICNMETDILDPDGVGYCTRHWPRHGNDWQLARDFWNGTTVKQKKKKKWEPGDGQESLI